MTIDEVRNVFGEFCRQQDITDLDFDATESATLPAGSEGAILHIQYRRDMGDVVLLAPLGELPDNSAAYVLEALLAANLYWQATHGATIAWSIDLSQPILQRALSESELTASALPDVLAGFLSAVEDWRANVSSLAKRKPAPPEPDDDDEGDDLPPPPPGAEGFIAV